jgi:hypothetical protein
MLNLSPLAQDSLWLCTHENVFIPFRFIKSDKAKDKCGMKLLKMQ